MEGAETLTVLSGRGQRESRLLAPSYPRCLVTFP